MDLAKKSIFKGFESSVCWMCLCYDVRKESKEEYRIRGAWRWRVAPLPVSGIKSKVGSPAFPRRTVVLPNGGDIFKCSLIGALMRR